ncbi:hypothetical protein ABW20_dc0104927 [Dactylellina cionopaga]|nr:hypothetical protein ABW20_dc0104927 [Dactylellina cionopaga]
MKIPSYKIALTLLIGGTTALLPPKFINTKRAANDTLSDTWKWDVNLGQRQLFWANKLVNKDFDSAVARSLASSVRRTTGMCTVKGEKNCVIGGCDPDTNIGLYLCSYKPKGEEVPCEEFGTIAEDIMYHWDKPKKEGMMVTGWTDKQVQAYSYWSTYVTMFTMPCLVEVAIAAD